MSQSELINIGLSEAAKDKLDWLQEQGYFAEKIDGYRFAIALTLSHGLIPSEISKRSTFLNVGSLDPDQAIKMAIEALCEEELQETTVYRLVERLADWGVNELYAQAQEGDINFVDILRELREKVR